MLIRYINQLKAVNISLRLLFGYKKIFIVYLQINYKHYIMKSISLIAKLLILAGLVQGKIISLEVCPYEMKFPL